MGLQGHLSQRILVLSYRLVQYPPVGVENLRMFGCPWWLNRCDSNSRYVTRLLGGHSTLSSQALRHFDWIYT